MPNVTSLLVDRVDLVGEGCNSEAFIKLYKRKGTGSMTFEEVLAKLKDEERSLIEQEVTKAKAEVPADTAQEIEDLKKAKQEAEEAVAKSKQEPEDFEEMIKGLDPKLQNILRQTEAKRVAAETAILKMRQEKEESIAKAKAEQLKNLPLKEDELISLVKGADEKMFKSLQAISKAFDENVLIEKGKNTPNPNTNSAWDQIDAKADSIAKSRNISKAKAISAVISEEPELYDKYQTELKGE